MKDDSEYEVYSGEAKDDNQHRAQQWFSAVYQETGAITHKNKLNVHKSPLRFRQEPIYET